MIRAIAVAALCAATPATAEVVRQGDSHFTVEHVLDIAAPPDAVWALIGQPSRWWSGQHSWSGDAANLSMDLRPGGCFCERLPGGGVEHARIVYIDRARLLRLSGALGPLQASGASGALTIELSPVPDGTTRMVMRYAVNGDAGVAVPTLAPMVDGVIGEQAMRLKNAVEAG
jgi:uncharacterized protein YndB with AHSA1/START domain